MEYPAAHHQYVRHQSNRVRSAAHGHFADLSDIKWQRYLRTCQPDHVRHEPGRDEQVRLPACGHTVRRADTSAKPIAGHGNIEWSSDVPGGADASELCGQYGAGNSDAGD